MKKTVTTTASILGILAITACGTGVDSEAYNAETDAPDNTVEETENLDSADNFEWNLPEVDSERVTDGFEQMWNSEHWDSIDNAQKNIEGWFAEQSEGGNVDVEEFFKNLESQDGNATAEEVDAPSGNAMGEDYDREKHFGSGWTDVNGSGCDTRQDILARDLNNVEIAENGCTVEYGVFLDATGEVIEFEQGVNSNIVDIDHIVALDWAFDNGAATWSQEMREQFAQDPANLWVMSANENRGAKSNFGPSDWMPTEDMQCDYVKQFLEVADAYQLEVPAEDRATEDAVC